jgi:RimJ/RimL family protein N-acetyltransferase
MTTGRRRAATIAIRPARPDDVDFLLEVLNDDDVRPFLAGGRPHDRAEIAAELERTTADPAAFGRLIIEVDGEPAGAMAYERVNERSRIAHLGGLAVHPDHRGRRIADEAARRLQRHLIDELGYHRLELEVYAFNDRAIAHAERAGFVREGVKRKAYLRDGAWLDSVLFALVEEDLLDGEER